MQKQFVKSAIHAVIFDFGEVLSFAPSEAAFERMAGEFGLPAAEFQQHYFEVRGPYDRGDCSAEAYWSSVAERSGAALSTRAIAKLRSWDVEMWSRMNPVMLAWLAAVRAAGFATGLLSNMHADMVAHARRHFAWLACFDQLTLSHERRSIKPEAALYRHCLQGLGVSAESALFIDDREVNVQGAREQGLLAIRFQSLAELETDLLRLGFPVLPSRVAKEMPSTLAASLE
jgi:putative hydrolase of the HAD superfamily